MGLLERRERSRRPCRFNVRRGAGGGGCCPPGARPASICFEAHASNPVQQGAHLAHRLPADAMAFSLAAAGQPGPLDRTLTASQQA